MSETSTTLRGKDARRQRIIDSAWVLFDELGYENVSTVQIAELAGVATRTVFNHFPRKEDIVFQRTDTVLARFEAGIRRPRSSAQRLTDSIRENALEMLEFEPGVAEEFTRTARLVATSPALQRRRFDILEAHARVLPRILIESDPALERGGLAEGLGHALVSIHWAVMEERGAAIARGESEPAAKAAAIHAINRGYDLLQTGFAAIDGSVHAVYV